MAVRSLEQLKVDQAALMDQLRPGAATTDPAAGGAETAEPVATMGKVTNVVGSDPTYGAHLVVQPQEFSGTPPTASAANRPTVRAYPTPGWVVTDYSLDEFISIQTFRGALLAVKLS